MIRDISIEAALRVPVFGFINNACLRIDGDGFVDEAPHGLDGDRVHWSRGSRVHFEDITVRLAEASGKSGGILFTCDPGTPGRRASGAVVMAAAEADKTPDRQSCLRIYYQGGGSSAGQSVVGSARIEGDAGSRKTDFVIPNQRDQPVAMILVIIIPVIIIPVIIIPTVMCFESGHSVMRRRCRSAVRHNCARPSECGISEPCRQGQQHLTSIFRRRRYEIAIIAIRLFLSPQAITRTCQSASSDKTLHSKCDSCGLNCPAQKFSTID